jgi:hypothetical protein
VFWRDFQSKGKWMMEPQKLRILAIKDKGEYCVIFTGLEMAHQDSALLRLQHKL